MKLAFAGVIERPNAKEISVRGWCSVPAKIVGRHAVFVARPVEFTGE
jgi:hypothetical protein